VRKTGFAKSATLAACRSPGDCWLIAVCNTAFLPFGAQNWHLLLASEPFFPVNASIEGLVLRSVCSVLILDVPRADLLRSSSINAYNKIASISSLPTIFAVGMFQIHCVKIRVRQRSNIIKNDLLPSQSAERKVRPRSQCVNIFVI